MGTVSEDGDDLEDVPAGGGDGNQFLGKK